MLLLKNVPKSEKYSQRFFWQAEPKQNVMPLPLLLHTHPYRQLK